MVPDAEWIRAHEDQAVNMFGQFLVRIEKSLPVAEKIQAVFICCDMKLVARLDGIVGVEFAVLGFQFF